ncbi:holo-ACP synthase [Methylacidiphilum caldifontis]|uniref:Holo-[acyl-carrier-protein] synthase n=1 Tax=Methylacidiphilum caldifontis TaxID=2795386 RepID=A0A4Y8PBL4_9BACT|nr:holo-ACP synthase [Methylacidiphilum caldifontis]QSR89239.1 holo-ACP synthase [Methylacidiphilum caldifontis]TFE68512.1 holo-[acyl-carrier-protein] synthase [Methylacidiphilum caldifontis]
MKIIGLGIDLVENSRIESLYSRYGERFLKKIYKETELSYCLARANPIPHLAARFAAKEAAIKALGSPVAYWKDIEVASLRNSPPKLLFHGEISKLCSSKGVSSILLSFTHTPLAATAVVILGG